MLVRGKRSGSGESDGDRGGVGGDATTHGHPHDPNNTHSGRKKAGALEPLTKRGERDANNPNNPSISNKPNHSYDSVSVGAGPSDGRDDPKVAPAPPANSSRTPFSSGETEKNKHKNLVYDKDKLTHLNNTPKSNDSVHRKSNGHILSHSGGSTTDARNGLNSYYEEPINLENPDGLGFVVPPIR